MEGTRVGRRASKKSHDRAEPRIFHSMRIITRPARFAKDEIVAIVLLLPEPFAALALMNGGIELRDWEKSVAAHETSLVAEASEIGKSIPDTAAREMAVLAFENQ